MGENFQVIDIHLHPSEVVTTVLCNFLKIRFPLHSIKVVEILVLIVKYYVKNILSLILQDLLQLNMINNMQRRSLNWIYELRDKMYEDSVKYLIEKEKSCSTLHSKTKDYFNALINYSPSPDADTK